MAKVILQSLSLAIEKNALIKLQVNFLEMPLKEAKKNVDFLLVKRKVILKIDDDDLAETFFKEAEKIGVNCELILS